MIVFSWVWACLCTHIGIMLGIKKSSQIIAGDIFWDAAGLQIMSFHSTSCWYNTDEKKSIPRGATVCYGVCTFSSCLWVCSGYRSFLPHPTDVHWEEQESLNWPSLGECGCEWVCPVMKWLPVCMCVVGGCSAPWVVRIGSGHVWPWTGIRGLERIILLVFIHLS